MRTYNLMLMLGFLLALTLGGCKHSDNTTAPTPYDNASILRGGILYNQFYAVEAGYDTASYTAHKYKAKSSFFACRACHGWDYKGQNGQYINRDASSSRAHIANVDLNEVALNDAPQDIFDFIKDATGKRDTGYDLSLYNATTNFTEGDKMPNFSQILTDADIWDIVKFIKEGTWNTDNLYDAVLTGTYPTGTITYNNLGLSGNATSGKTWYISKCGPCHGNTGQGPQLVGPGGAQTLGFYARANAGDVHHRVRFGQLGTAMTPNFQITLAQMQDLYKALSDTLSFPNNP
jgi:mono/diheme cytochrome c family protein